MASNSGAQEYARKHGIEEKVTLNSFFEKDVRPYIDLINEISDFGLGAELDLPSVVVIGDQSSGKSSILEAISGVPLPRGKNITTRCPIELHLKKAEGNNSCRIEYTDRNRKNQSLSVDLENLDQTLRTAQDAITDPGKVTDSKITLKIQGPSCPDLTLTDLPGIVRTSVNEDDAIINRIRKLINDQIARESVIILCVIPAHVDLATNEALSIAKKHDHARKRTIGVLTKADLVENKCEDSVLEVLSNKTVHLSLGYCIVQCRSAADLSIPHATAIAQEERFFQNHHQFKHLKPEQRGTKSLSTKLTQVLVSHMKHQLPRLRTETRDKLAALQKELDSFGCNVPTSEEAKRRFMMDLLDKVRRDMETYLINGSRVRVDVLKSENVPVDEIEHAECDTSFLWRSLFSNFNEEIKNITAGHLNFQNGNLSTKAIQIRMTALRGKELPRFFNFELFEELVRNHLKMYEEPAVECLEEVTRGVGKIAMYVCEERLKQFPALLSKVEEECQQVLEDCQKSAKKMVLRELKKEKLIFTQDCTYLAEIRKLMESKENPRSAHSSFSGSDCAKQLSIHLLHSEGEEGNEDQHNAQVMHHIVTVYLNVVNTRLSDSIPQTIRLDLYEKFVKAINKKILHSLFNEDTTLIDEDTETTARRKELQEKICSLKNVIARLKNFNG